MLARTESKASLILSGCVPPACSTKAIFASRIFPPNAFPRIISCTRGKIMDASIKAGERKNFRISRSTMAIMRFIRKAPHNGSWLQPRPLRHHKRVRLLQFIAELPSGVVDKDVIECGVLHRQRFHRYAGCDRHLHEFGG